jgi:heme/copper-type cytochrome/quinol oxidase subunit 2
VLANATKLLVVGGIWLLVILIIIWLVKKYRDSQSKEKSIEALANRFRTQDPKDQSKPVTPPTPTTQPTPPPPPTPQS